MLSFDRADKSKPEKRGENRPKLLKTSLTSPNSAGQARFSSVFG
jgi:hypothetical protein